MKHTYLCLIWAKQLPEIQCPVLESKNIHRFSYVPRTIREWNGLPSIIMMAPNLNEFKRCLSEVLRRLHTRKNLQFWSWKVIHEKQKKHLTYKAITTLKDLKWVQNNDEVNLRTLIQENLELCVKLENLPGSVFRTNIGSPRGGEASALT